jgi:hypothetical protein
MMGCIGTGSTGPKIEKDNLPTEKADKPPRSHRMLAEKQVTFDIGPHRTLENKRPIKVVGSIIFFLKNIKINIQLVCTEVNL